MGQSQRAPCRSVSSVWILIGVQEPRTRVCWYLCSCACACARYRGPQVKNTKKMHRSNAGLILSRARMCMHACMPMRQCVCSRVRVYVCMHVSLWSHMIRACMCKHAESMKSLSVLKILEMRASKQRAHKARRMQQHPSCSPSPLFFFLLCQTCSRPQPTSIPNLTRTGTPPSPPSTPACHPTTTHGAARTCAWRPEAAHNSVRCWHAAKAEIFDFKSKLLTSNRNS